MSLIQDRYVNNFVSELISNGLKHVVISPGSRNTPLTLAFTNPNFSIKTWLHLDERSAAYFALGMAREINSPVALVCTSGTAVANYLPAIVEANLSRIPLIVITADRPPVLRERGASQTINQINIFGDHVKWFFDMPIVENDGMDKFAKTTATKAYVVSNNSPSGPVHINFPLSEPLIDDETDTYTSNASEVDSFAHASDFFGGQSLGDLAKKISHKKGIIIAGPGVKEHEDGEIVRLAKSFGWPVLADPLSNIRTGPNIYDGIIAHSDLALRHIGFSDLACPEVILRFGAVPVSKVLNQWLAQLPKALHVLFDEISSDTLDWRDPDSNSTLFFRGELSWICDQLIQSIPSDHTITSDWLNLWKNADQIISASITTWEAENTETFEATPIIKLAKLLHENSVLIAGNSMPIRDIDSFFPKLEKKIYIRGNRGAAGIDGVISSAAGAAAVSSSPTTLLIGDLSFFHDQNGLWPIYAYDLDLTVILINNNGGGIFEFLPQKKLVGSRFEPFFGTPHNLDFSYTTQLFNGRHHLISMEDFSQIFTKCQDNSGLDVIEIQTDRNRNVDLHQIVMEYVNLQLSNYFTDLG